MSEESLRLHSGSIDTLTITNLVVNSRGESVPTTLWRCGAIELDGEFNVTLEEQLTFPGVKSERSEQRILSVLLIEHMGEHLKESEDEIEDIRDVLRDLARKRMAHQDIRYNNILQAPKSPPGYLGSYRIIDFEQGQKVENAKLPEISTYYVQQLADIHREYN
ncbi:hypothetical protein BDQ17DRAFT_1327492 [Cyathus striatus]|nr:hypothetical protein BDQ17DRAFT_1327492 [Cyathus striatus]